MSVTFSIRKKLLSQDRYVFVTLPGGRQRKVGRFRSQLDAESWVQFRSPEWVAQHQKEFGLDIGAGKELAKGKTALW